MILIVSKDQILSDKLSKIVESINEKTEHLSPGFSFVNGFQELENDEVDVIIFDEDAMERTIPLLERNHKIDLLKVIDIVKIVNDVSDNYIYPTVSSIEIEKDSVEDELPLILKSFME